jgi:putative ABC transport system permease protein
MGWIAIKMLTGDRAKFIGIVFGIAFAAALIMQQGSIFWGLMLRTCAQIYDLRGADLWVMDPSVAFIDDVKPMLERQLGIVRGVDGIKWAVPLYKGNARTKLTFTDPASGRRVDITEQVILIGLDDHSFVGEPASMFLGNIEDLNRPNSVVLDRVGLRKIFPRLGLNMIESPGVLRARLAELSGRRMLPATMKSMSGADARPVNVADSAADGARQKTDRLETSPVLFEMEMNEKRAEVVGICMASRTFQSNPVIYTTFSRAKQFVPRERKLLSYVLVKVLPGQDPLEVARRIKQQTGLAALTTDQFVEKTINYYLRFTGIPINFMTTVVLGFFVGTAIAGQMFYSFTLENIKQFGALKAMGVGNLRIIGMVLLQAALVGFLGFGLGVGAATLFGMANRGANSELAFYTHWYLLCLDAAAITIICFLASLLSVLKVVLLEPAIVFRG